MAGDVCGKGMPAAIFMSRTMTLLRSEAMNQAGRTQRHHTLELLNGAMNRDAAAVEAIDGFVQAHAQSDDLTLLALRYTGAL